MFLTKFYRAEEEMDKCLWVVCRKREALFVWSMDSDASFSALREEVKS
jgi:hypothetical protein